MDVDDWVYGGTVGVGLRFPEGKTGRIHPGNEVSVWKEKAH
jgi:hypothetical protein